MRMQNICFTDLTTTLKCQVEKKMIKHTLKIKDSIGLEKIEERDKQFLVEKIIHGVEFQNP